LSIFTESGMSDKVARDRLSLEPQPPSTALRLQSTRVMAAVAYTTLPDDHG
jgi:hypothetical protein